jgi:hypothetical protein
VAVLVRLETIPYSALLRPLVAETAATTIPMQTAETVVRAAALVLLVQQQEPLDQETHLQFRQVKAIMAAPHRLQIVLALGAVVAAHRLSEGMVLVLQLHLQAEMAALAQRLQLAVHL